MTNQHADFTTSGTPYTVIEQADGNWTLQIEGYGQRNISNLKRAILIANDASPFSMIVVGLRKI